MQIEDVAGICFTSRRPSDQQGDRTISDRVLGEVIVDNEDVFALVHKIFAHRAARIGSDELQRRRLGGCRRYNNGVGHGVCGAQVGDQAGHGGSLLADCDVNTDNVLALLVDDGVDCNCCLACLTVADDQLTLASADRDHRVDRLDTCLQGLFDRLTFDDAGCGGFYRAELAGLDRTRAVDRLSNRVYNTADHCLADGNGNDTAGALDSLSFADTCVFSEQNG